MLWKKISLVEFQRGLDRDVEEFCDRKIALLRSRLSVCDSRGLARRLEFRIKYFRMLKRS